jgi:hypothetical protein
MPDKHKKPRSPKQGAADSNFLASIPWRKRKAILIPSLATVLVISLVGVVLALQAANPTKVSDDASSDSEAIGFACVSGTPICEEVKSILLKTDYDEVVANWTRESLIAHLEYKYGRSRIFATEVVDSIKFDWGDGSSVGACVSGELICDQARYVLITTDQGKQFTREEFISTWMDWYGGTREKVEAIIDELGFTSWSGSASSGGSSKSPSTSGLSIPNPGVPAPNVPAPIVGSTTGLSATEKARIHIDSWNSTNYANSRLVTIDYLVDLYQLSREEATTALDGLNVNWNLNAAKAARYFDAQSLWFMNYESRIGWVEFLSSEFLFTQSEAEYGVDSLNIDWNSQASRAAVRVLEHFDCNFFVEYDEFGPSALIYELAGYIVGTFDFTEDEAISGAWNQLEMEGDWVWKPLPNCGP